MQRENDVKPADEVVNIDSRTQKTLKCYWQFAKRNRQFLHQLTTILGPASESNVFRKATAFPRCIRLLTTAEIERWILYRFARD